MILDFPANAILQFTTIITNLMVAWRQIQSMATGQWAMGNATKLGTFLNDDCPGFSDCIDCASAPHCTTCIELLPVAWTNALVSFCTLFWLDLVRSELDIVFWTIFCVAFDIDTSDMILSARSCTARLSHCLYLWSWLDAWLVDTQQHNNRIASRNATGRHRLSGRAP